MEKIVKNNVPADPNIDLVKSSIYSILYGKNNIKEPVDALIVGFFIGHLSANGYKIEEKNLQHIKTIYTALASKNGDLDSLLSAFVTEILNISQGMHKKEIKQSHQIIEPQYNLIEEVNDEDINNFNAYFNNSISTNIIEKQIESCSICVEEFDALSEDNAFLECGCVIHSECFLRFLEINIKENKLPIKCPMLKCNKEIDAFIIYEALEDDLELLDKYEKFTLQFYLTKNPKDVSCCPTPGCEYLFFYNPGDIQYYCPSCTNSYCLSCKVEWHEGDSCENYKLSHDVNALDKMFYDFVSGAKFKMCENCRFWVEKNEGCNHMVCRCNYEFCFQCGGKWEDHDVCGVTKSSSERKQVSDSVRKTKKMKYAKKLAKYRKNK